MTTPYEPPSPLATTFYLLLMAVCALGVYASFADIRANGISANASWIGWLVVAKFAHKRITKPDVKEIR